MDCATAGQRIEPPGDLSPAAGPGSRARCVCGAPTAFVCDAPTADGGTCGAPLCADCRVQLLDGRDLCERCAEAERAGRDAVPPWERWRLSEIADPLEQPHPLDEETPRRFWRGWHYAVLLLTAEAATWPAALERLPERLRADAGRQLRWMRAHGIDPAPVQAEIARWSADRGARARCIGVAERRRRLRGRSAT
ncbi:MAG: hypothetical protein K9M02_01060 [Thiohalocapsa sp.]|nr:hypothetical protein [Thiohalocapsa sp.]